MPTIHTVRTPEQGNIARLAQMLETDQAFAQRCLNAARDALSSGNRLRNYKCFSCGRAQLDEGAVANAPPTSTRRCYFCHKAWHATGHAANPLAAFQPILIGNIIRLRLGRDDYLSDFVVANAEPTRIRPVPTRRRRARRSTLTVRPSWATPPRRNQEA